MEVGFARWDKFPKKKVVSMMQAGAVEGGPTLHTRLGVASLDFDGLYKEENHDHRVICVPGGADPLKKRRPVCAQLEWAGRRGVDAVMARLERHCMWERGKTVSHSRRAIMLCWLQYSGSASTVTS